MFLLGAIAKYLKSGCWASSCIHVCSSVRLQLYISN